MEKKYLGFRKNSLLAKHTWIKYQAIYNFQPHLIHVSHTPKIHDLGVLFCALTLFLFHVNPNGLSISYMIRVLITIC